MPDYFDWATPLPKTNPRWLAIFRPFTKETWICFIVTLLGAGPVLAALAYLSAYNGGPNLGPNSFGLQKSTLYMLSNLLDNSIASTHQLPPARAPKIFISVWFIILLYLVLNII